MNEKKKTSRNRTTPLRNSDSANKPFRSPLTNFVSPKTNESPKNFQLGASPLAKTATPKRPGSQFRPLIKRRRIGNTESEEPVEISSKVIGEAIASRPDLLALKKRVSAKRRELESLKTRLNYVRKHSNSDLVVQTEMWRTVCKEALFRFKKDVSARAEKPLSMLEVLSTLGISRETVQFTDEEWDSS